MCRCCSRDLGVNVQFWNIWEPRRKTHQPELWESISCQVNQQGGTCSPKLNCHFLFIWISWDGYFAKLPVELIDLHVWDRGSSVTLLASLVGSVRQHRHWRSSPPPRPAPPPCQAPAGSTISIPGISERGFVKIPGSRDFRDGISLNF